MMHWLRLFFLIFHAIYFAMNLYVFWRLLGYFGIRSPLVILPLVVVGVLSLTTATMVYYNLGPAYYPLYFAMTLWFGVLWLLFWCLLILEPLRPFMKGVNPAHIGTMVIAIVAVLTAYSIYHASRPKVTTVKVAAPAGMRIVQISDLHIGSVRPRYVQKVIGIVNSLNPDIVVATGDILDANGAISSEGLALFSQIKVPLIAVTGNHEVYAGLEQSVASLRSAGFTVLRGKTMDFRGIRLIGFDDDAREGLVASDLARAGIDPAAFNVLLFHHPRGFPDAAEAGVKLMLSGHTHHGQLFPFNLLLHLAYDYPCGLYRIGDSMLYTSQGTGTWGPRMRLGTDAEIVVFELATADAKP
jgi:uncharacterized protein